LNPRPSGYEQLDKRPSGTAEYRPSRKARLGVRAVPLSPPSTAESGPTGDEFGDRKAAPPAGARSVLDVEGVAERAVQIGTGPEVEVADGLVIE